MTSRRWRTSCANLAGRSARARLAADRSGRPHPSRDRGPRHVLPLSREPARSRRRPAQSQSAKALRSAVEGTFG
jgi:hypothetical protein